MSAALKAYAKLVMSADKGAVRDLSLLANQAVSKLRTSFGGNPTEGERKILMDLSGIGSKSIEERAVIIKNAYKALNSAAERQSRRLRDINEGRYRETVEPAPAASEGP